MSETAWLGKWAANAIELVCNCTMLNEIKLPKFVAHLPS